MGVEGAGGDEEGVYEVDEGGDWRLGDRGEGVKRAVGGATRELNESGGGGPPCLLGVGGH